MRFQRDSRVFQVVKRKPSYIPVVEDQAIIRHPGGRPSKRTDEVEAKICEGLSYGLSNLEVAALVNIDESTFYAWSQDPAFQERIAGAKAERKLVWIKNIEAGEKGWVGSAWLLERCDPLKWARPEISLMIANSNQGDGAIAGPSEAALIKGLANYHQLKNGHRKEPEEDPGEAQRCDSESE